MTYASWSRRRRRNRQGSPRSPARKRKAGLDQARAMENARPMRRMTRKRTANRSECRGFWVLPVPPGQENGAASGVVSRVGERRTCGLSCGGWAGPSDKG